MVELHQTGTFRTLPTKLQRRGKFATLQHQEGNNSAFVFEFQYKKRRINKQIL